MNELDDMRTKVEAVADDLQALEQFADPGEALNLLLRGDPNWLRKRVATLVEAAGGMSLLRRGVAGSRSNGNPLRGTQAAKVEKMKGEADADS